VTTGNESKKPATRQNAVDIASLIASLGAAGAISRQSARKRLVSVGKPAVPHLIKCLSDPRGHVRWEAAKALGSIRDPNAAGVLVNALEDKDGDVRWLAAVGLATLGHDGLQPLLMALLERPDSDWLRDGAHHVCHNLARAESGELVRPLLVALDQQEPEMAVPQAAYEVLSALRGQV